MNIESFYCQHCTEKSIYSGLKPRYCCYCGKSFAVFSSAVVTPKPSPPAAPASEDDNPFFEPKPTIRPASYYRNRSKAKEQELEDDIDDDLDDDGEQGEFGADSGESLQQLFDQGLTKRNKGVKFGDIISKETFANEQSKKPEAADKPKLKKLGRPRKKR